MSQTKLVRSILLLVLVFSVYPSLCQAQKDGAKKSKVLPTGPAVLWREPVDITTRNLLTGAGGDAMKPDLSKVTFVKDETGGASTKYRVHDGAGNTWIAKVSKEAQSETAANRLVWAAGYETEIVYLVPKLTIVGKGSFDNVRLEARPKSIKRSVEWSWASNPFLHSNELQALKIMMVLINNWDMKDSNNQILVATSPTNGETELRYVISDLGASLGKTGGVFSRSRNKPSDFIKSQFVTGVKGNLVNFSYSGKEKSLFEDITVEQARWLAGRLSKLSDEQLKDAFRAANYSSTEVDQMAQAVRERINKLSSL